MPGTQAFEMDTARRTDSTGGRDKMIMGGVGAVVVLGALIGIIVACSGGNGGKAEAAPITLVMTLENLNYDKLMKDTAIHDATVKALEGGIAEEAGEGVTEKDVTVTLSKGSVKVSAAIRPEGAEAIAAVFSKLNEADELPKVLSNVIAAVADIEAVGDITIAGIKVTKDEKKDVVDVDPGNENGNGGSDSTEDGTEDEDDNDGNEDGNGGNDENEDGNSENEDEQKDPAEPTTDDQTNDVDPDTEDDQTDTADPVPEDNKNPAEPAPKDDQPDAVLLGDDSTVDGGSDSTVDGSTENEDDNKNLAEPPKDDQTNDVDAGTEDDQPDAVEPGDDQTGAVDLAPVAAATSSNAGGANSGATALIV